MALYRTKSGRFTRRKTGRRVSSGRKRRRRRNPTTARRTTTARRRNPVRARAANPRKRRRRRNITRIRSRRSFNPRNALYRVRKGYGGRKRSRIKRKRLRGGNYSGQASVSRGRAIRRKRRRNPVARRRNPRRRRNPTYYANPRRRRRRRRNPGFRRNPATIMGALKGSLRSLTNPRTLAQYAWGGIGILVANTGGGFLAAKVREMADQETPGAAIAKQTADGQINLVGVVVESAIKIVATSVSAVLAPARFRQSFMIGGAATALWDVIKVGLLQFAPDLATKIGLDGWLTDSELRQLGLSGWLSKPQTTRLALRAPNPQYIRLPGAQHQFSGA